MRRNKEKFAKKEKELHDANEELDRAQRLLRKMKGLIEDKQLAERDDLQRKLTKAEKELAEKDRSIKVRKQIHFRNYENDGGMIIAAAGYLNKHFE